MRHTFVIVEHFHDYFSRDFFVCVKLHTHTHTQTLPSVLTYLNNTNFIDSLAITRTYDKLPHGFYIYILFFTCFSIIFIEVE